MSLDTLLLPLLPLPSVEVNGGSVSGGSGSGGSGSGDTGGSGSGTDIYLGYTDGYIVQPDAGDGWVSVVAARAADLPETTSVVAPQACLLRFVPAASGGTLPDGSLVAADTWVLTVLPDAVAGYQLELPARPIPASWVLQGIEMASFEAQLDLWKTTANPNDLLAAWVDSNPPEIDALVQDNWKQQVLTGAHDVQLEAGIVIGDMAAPDVQLHLTLVDPSGERVHPALALPGFPDANPALAEHPLLVALETLDIDVQIHLRFLHLHVDQAKASGKKGAMSPLVGATVAAINASPGNVMDTGVTDADGRVTFYASNWDWPLVGGTADIYFDVTVDEATPITVQYGRRSAWHGTWSTWFPGDPQSQPGDVDRPPGAAMALDGSPGYYPDYGGWQLGTTASPLTFNVGTPVILALTYEALKDPGKVAPRRPAARGTEIEFWWTSPNQHSSIADTFFADEDGEVWGTTFALTYGTEHQIVVPLAIAEDSRADFVDSISLPRVVTLINPTAWEGVREQPSSCHWAAFSQPSIDAKGAPLPIVVWATPNDDRAAWLYLLKCVRDTHVWWRTITGSRWQGVEGAWLHLNDTVIADVIEYFATVLGQYVPSNNPPYLGVLLRPANKWDRETACHELSHGVMWAITTIGLEDFACALVWGDYANHRFFSELSEFAALAEGWADLAGAALDGDGTYASSLSAVPATVTDASGALVPPAAPLGLSIEGCFAGAFWEWLRTEHHVESCVDADGVNLKRRDPGTGHLTDNVTIAGASAAFQVALWDPATQLPDPVTGYPGTGDLLALTQAGMPSIDFANLSAYLHPWGLS